MTIIKLQIKTMIMKYYLPVNFQNINILNISDDTKKYKLSYDVSWSINW